MTLPDPLAPAPNPAPGFRRHPDHTISVSPHVGRVVVRLGGRVLASTEAALELAEASYPKVFYIPFADIAFNLMARGATATHCPFKGDATYWHAGLAGDAGPDVMWAYETPYDEMAAIRNHGAFYPDRVTIEAE
jgi:uncharacterized protein (DUF427 family)